LHLLAVPKADYTLTQIRHIDAQATSRYTDESHLRLDVMIYVHTGPGPAWSGVVSMFNLAKQRHHRAVPKRGDCDLSLITQDIASACKD
ncbi:MAG: hypothetical protein ACQERT_09470, partial [Thermodesulfobacteriota bacterium]